MDTILLFKETSSLECKLLLGEMFRTQIVYNQLKVFQFLHITEDGEYRNLWGIFIYK